MALNSFSDTGRGITKNQCEGLNDLILNRPRGSGCWESEEAPSKDGKDWILHGMRARNPTWEEFKKILEGSGKGGCRMEEHAAKLRAGLFLTTCVRYPHDVPFLINEMPFSILKTPKTHAV